MRPLGPLAPTAATVEAVPPAVHAAPWRSPVPYLFGGLASMLGLITFALLVLACSYWKLSGYLERVDSAEHVTETAGSGGHGRKAVDEAQEKQITALEERFVVIMAGDEKKIFLANPIRSRASTFAGGGGGDEQSSAVSAAAKNGGDESDGGVEMVTENCAVNVSGGDSTHNHI